MSCIPSSSHTQHAHSYRCTLTPADEPFCCSHVPQYHYYYEWTRQRISQQCGGPGSLPVPVVQRLLQLDANDLDIMLQHPRAIRAQVVMRSILARWPTSLYTCLGELVWEPAKDTSSTNMMITIITITI